MERKHLFVLMGVILCVTLSVYYFLHYMQTFAQNKIERAEVLDAVKPVDLSKIQLDRPMGKEDGMVIYEIFVRSFYDSNGDGIGDLNGVTEKLDYLKKLGVNAVWLMPITDSPSYHGYDVSDYYKVDPDYGTLEDFNRLVEEAHKKGIKIIMDLVINHTSSQHPWFLEANKSKNSRYRNYYIWADNKTNLKGLNDQNNRTAWSTKGNGYYFSEFSEDMPDLNYDNKEVREEIKSMAKFWMDQGVDGFRMDAARFIYPQKRTQDTLNWWQEFGDYIRGIKEDVYIVGEIWSDEITISKYLKVLNSAFNFPVAMQTVNAARSGNPAELIRQMENTYNQYQKINGDYVDTPFLTNHDQNRVMSELMDNAKARSAAAIYLTLPGNPVIYYGEEIGMKGKKPDEAIREPFKWYEADGKGQTTWRKMTFNSSKDVLSVEEQEKDNNSLLNYYRDMIRFRLSSPVLSKGDIHIINDVNKVLAYTRSYKGVTNLIVHNLKGEEISVEFNLPDNVNIKGVVTKGKGKVSLKEKTASIKLDANSFVIIE